MAHFWPASRSPHGRTTGPGTRLGAHLCAQGLEGGFLSSSKSSHGQEVPLPSWLEGPQGQGEPQPFLANVLSGQGTTSTGELGAIKMRTYDLSSLRKAQGKFTLWLILFLSCVFYYSSWQRTCSEEKKVIW